MLLLTHLPPSVHPRRNLAQPSGVRARAAPAAFHHLTRSNFWFRICLRNEEKRGIWTELVFAQHQTWHMPLTLLPTDSPTARLRQGPQWLPLHISSLYSGLMCESLCALLVTSPPESRMPVMETAPDKSEWDAGALKGRMRGEVGEEFGGKRVRDLLNHHWKLIRKLAGPGGAGRTDCALPSTMPVMKWKLGGSVPGQISLH